MKILCCGACGHTLIEILEPTCPKCGIPTTQAARFTLAEQAVVMAKYRRLGKADPDYTQADFDRDSKDLFGA